MHEGEAPRISRHCLQLTVPLLLIFSQNRGKNAFVSEKGYKSQAKRSKSYPLLLTSVQNRPKSNRPYPVLGCSQRTFPPLRTNPYAKNGFYGRNLNECTSGGGNRNQKPRNVPRKRRSTIGFSASHKPRALQHRNGQEVLRASGRISGTVPTQSSLQRIVENFRSGGQFDRLVNQIAIIRRETGFRQAIAGNW